MGQDRCIPNFKRTYQEMQSLHAKTVCRKRSSALSGDSENIDVIVEEGVKIVFTSAAIPPCDIFLKERNITVVHVVSSVKFARKAEEPRDAIVAEEV